MLAFIFMVSVCVRWRRTAQPKRLESDSHKHAKPVSSVRWSKARRHAHSRTFVRTHVQHSVFLTNVSVQVLSREKKNYQQLRICTYSHCVCECFARECVCVRRVRCTLNGVLRVRNEAADVIWSGCLRFIYTPKNFTISHNNKEINVCAGSIRISCMPHLIEYSMYATFTAHTAHWEYIHTISISIFYEMIASQVFSFFSTSTTTKIDRHHCIDDK